MTGDYYYETEPCERYDSIGRPCILDYWHRGPCEHLPLPPNEIVGGTCTKCGKQQSVVRYGVPHETNVTLCYECFQQGK